MPIAPDLQKQAREKQELAAQARRWAGEMTQDADRDHLLRIAAELEAEAVELERQASSKATQVQPPGFSGTQPLQQVQQQQQQEQQQEQEQPKGIADRDKR